MLRIMSLVMRQLLKHQYGLLQQYHRQIYPQLAATPTEKLLNLDILQPENIRDMLHACQMAKRCNEKRVMAEAVKWGECGAKLGSLLRELL